MQPGLSKGTRLGAAFARSGSGVFGFANKLGEGLIVSRREKVDGVFGSSKIELYDANNTILHTEIISSGSLYYYGLRLAYEKNLEFPRLFCNSSEAFINGSGRGFRFLDAEEFTAGGGVASPEFNWLGLGNEWRFPVIDIFDTQAGDQLFHGIASRDGRFPIRVDYKVDLHESPPVGLGNDVTDRQQVLCFADAWEINASNLSNGIRAIDWIIKPEIVQYMQWYEIGYGGNLELRTDPEPQLGTYFECELDEINNRLYFINQGQGGLFRLGYVDLHVSRDNYTALYSDATARYLSICSTGAGGVFGLLKSGTTYSIRAWNNGGASLHSFAQANTSSMQHSAVRWSRTLGKIYWNEYDNDADQQVIYRAPYADHVLGEIEEVKRFDGSLFYGFEVTA